MLVSGAANSTLPSRALPAVDGQPLRSPRRLSRMEPLRLRSAPVLIAGLFFILGILFFARAWLTPASLLVAMLLLAALTLVALHVAPRMAVLPLCSVWMVLGMFSAEVERMPSPQRALLGYADGLSRQISGDIVRINLPRDQHNIFSHDVEQTESVDIQVNAIEEVTPEAARMVPVQGGVRLLLTTDVKSALPPLLCGQHIHASMQMHPPEKFLDPGAWDYPGYLLQQGISAQATLATSKISLTPPAHRSPACLLHEAQAWASGRWLDYTRSAANMHLPAPFHLTDEDANTLSAMIFGDRSHLDHTLRAGFERIGCFHLFVVSGLHLAVVAGGILWLLRRVFCLPYPPAAMLTLLLATFYALLTGWGVPVQRALWMTAVFLALRWLWRDRNVLNALGIAALSVLLLTPHALFDSSFQMTFLAIVAIGGIATPLGERSFVPYARATHSLQTLDLDATLPPRVAQFRVTLRLLGRHLQPLLYPLSPRLASALPALIVRWTLWLCELTLLCLVAECLMVLPMAIYFHRVAVMALPANLLSVPIVCVLVPLALIAFGASLVHPLLAALPAAATAAILHGVTYTVTHMSKLAIADQRMPPPAPGAIVIALLAWAFAVWSMRQQRRWAMVGVILLPLTAALLLWPRTPHFHHGELEVTAIDVGQGDSIFIVSPDGQTMLVDAGGPVGGPFANASPFDIGEEVVSPYLWSRGVRRLEIIALTHAHSDHMGGMPAVLRNFRPRELWVGNNPHTASYDALLNEAAVLGIRVRSFHAGETVEFGPAHIQMLAPQAGYRPGPKPVNNDSLVMEIHYGRGSALLEGDAEAPSERAMLAAGLVQPATLLKAGHHGSRTSSTPEFLAAAAPEDAVISAGRRNHFGHPRPEVVQQFAAAHVKLARTDLTGATTFLLKPDGSIEMRSYASNP